MRRLRRSIWRWRKSWGWIAEKVNVNGGAVALGHPLGATGTRLVITLLYELRRRKKKYGLATACVGGGRGIAMVVESFPVGGQDMRNLILDGASWGTKDDVYNAFFKVVGAPSWHGRNLDALGNPALQPEASTKWKFLINL